MIAQGLDHFVLIIGEEGGGHFVKINVRFGNFGIVNFEIAIPKFPN